MNEQLRNLFSQLEGRHVPGGCDDCDAVQEIKADPEHDGMYHCLIHHDDGCPWLAAYEARSGLTPPQLANYRKQLRERLDRNSK
jgi:hypothetical protein